MSTVNALKKEVTELKSRVNPEPKHLVIDFSLSTDNDPHGFLNGSLFHLVIDKHGQETRWHEAIDTETELASNKAYYDSVLCKPTDKFMKNPTHPFHSFESFLEYSRCKCGKHGVSGMEPYLGANRVISELTLKAES